MAELQIGNRVKISTLARNRHIGYKDPNRQGVIIGRPKSSPDCVRVRWDGNHTASTMHQDFVELVK